MADLKDINRVVEELNQIEREMNGKSTEEKIKMVDKQAYLWCELNALVDDIVCKWS